MEKSWTVSEAFDYCSQLTKSHYENFPVGSFLMPKALQPAVHSLYAFMRTADDFSDEERQPGDEAERSAYLDSWDQLLTDCEQGQARHPIFIALQDTLKRYQLPAQWLRDLLTAFKMDVTVRRYPTYLHLLNYCRYSANPVGRLILTLSGYRSEELYQLSDFICTALQLANHWQDVAIDLEKDRIYLPLEDLKRFDVPVSALQQRVCNPSFQELLRFQVHRTREMFAKGRPLPSRVRGRLRWELRLTWEGGSRILDKTEAVDYDVFGHRPTLTKLDWILLGANALLHPHG
jgi:squalene synthase HpnC